jgi:hypothetical protein
MLLRELFENINQPLIAPNGKKSNLNKGQYYLVRTPAFKEWFGDWEHNPKQSSKILDNNGEPLVVYHGTNSNIFTFNKDTLGSKTKARSAMKGFFFTNSPDNAETYTNMRDDPYSWKKKISPEEQAELQRLKDYTNELKPKNSKYDDWKMSDEWRTRNAAEIDYMSGILHKYSSGPNIIPVFLDIKNPLIYDFHGSEYRDITFNDLLKKAKKNKKDGALLKNTYDPLLNNVLVTFSPNQIKSAIGNTGDYSKESDNFNESA